LPRAMAAANDQDALWEAARGFILLEVQTGCNCKAESDRAICIGAALWRAQERGDTPEGLPRRSRIWWRETVRFILKFGIDGLGVRDMFREGREPIGCRNGQRNLRPLTY
jgi:hypothetical protein